MFYSSYALETLRLQRSCGVCSGTVLWEKQNLRMWKVSENLASKASLMLAQKSWAVPASARGTQKEGSRIRLIGSKDYAVSWQRSWWEGCLGF